MVGGGWDHDSPMQSWHLKVPRPAKTRQLLVFFHKTVQYMASTWYLFMKVVAKSTRRRKVIKYILGLLICYEKRLISVRRMHKLAIGSFCQRLDSGENVYKMVTLRIFLETLNLGRRVHEIFVDLFIEGSIRD